VRPPFGVLTAWFYCGDSLRERSGESISVPTLSHNNQLRSLPRHALAIGLIGEDFGRLDIPPIEDCHQLICGRTVFGPGAGRTRGRWRGWRRQCARIGNHMQTVNVRCHACGEPAWPRLLTSSRRKGVGIRLATPAVKKYPPIRARAAHKDRPAGADAEVSRWRGERRYSGWCGAPASIRPGAAASPANAGATQASPMRQTPSARTQERRNSEWQSGVDFDTWVTLPLRGSGR